jgi:hypothetical protein
MRVRCTSTTTTDEKAVGGGVEELVGAVRAYVKGGETTKVEGGRGVDEVVAALKEAKVEASAGRRETRGRWNGLDVVVRVAREGVEVQVVSRVEVVPRVVVAEYGVEVEIAGRVWMAENWDGDMGGAIKRAQSDEEWKQADENMVPAWCYHDQNPGNARGWGKLYNKHVVKGVLPVGGNVRRRERAHQVLQRRRGA